MPALSENKRTLLGQCELLYTTLSDCQMSFDLNNVNDFLKACLQQLVKEETNDCRYLEPDKINLLVSLKPIDRSKQKKTYREKNNNFR